MLNIVQRVCFKISTIMDMPSWIIEVMLAVSEAKKI
jgi:hypothetical protein